MAVPVLNTPLVGPYPKKKKKKKAAPAPATTRSSTTTTRARAQKPARKKAGAPRGQKVGYQGSAFTDMSFPDFLQLLSEGEINSQAAAAAQSQTMAATAGLRAQLASMQRQAQRQAQVAEGAYAGLGRLLGPIAPEIQGIYQKAADSQIAGAQGFSGALKDQATADAQANAALLQQQGLPPTPERPTGENVLYGLGGYIPSSTMGREGAAWSSYAATLPAASARAGQMEIADIMRAASEAQAPVQGSIAEAQAGQAALQQQIAQDLFARNLQAWQAQQQAINDQRNYQLNLQSAKMAAKKLGLDASDTQWDNLVNAGFDPTTGQRLPAEPSKPNASLSKIYGYVVDDMGNAILGPDGKPTKVKTGKSGQGFSQREWADTNIDVRKFARDLYEGRSEANPNYDPNAFPGDPGYGQPEKVNKRVSRQRAFNMLWNEYVALIPKNSTAKARLRKFIIQALDDAGWPRKGARRNQPNPFLASPNNPFSPPFLNG